MGPIGPQVEGEEGARANCTEGLEAQGWDRHGILAGQEGAGPGVAIQLIGWPAAQEIEVEND